jgi:putative ABC transport system permease protein
MSAGVIVASAITSHVLAQMREVGVLKASGFGPRHITLTFLLEQLALSLPAAIVGSVIGILTAPTILDRFGTSLHFKPPPEFDPSVMSMVVGTVLLLILAFTFFPSWRAGRISTVAAISNLHRAGGNTASRMASVAIRLHLPRVTAMGAKDLFAHRTRAWLTVVAVAVAVVTALFVSMLFGTLSRFDSDPVSYGAWPYELQVYVLPEFGTGDASSGFLAAGAANPIPREEVMAVANSFNEIVGIVESREVWTRPQGFESSIPTYILDGNAQDLGFRLVEGRLFASTGEAIMGLGLAQTTGKRLGDEVTTYVPLDPHKTGEDDEWQAVLLEIVGTYISTANVGRNLVYSGDSIAGMDIVPSPGLISLKLAPDADRDLLAARFTAATDGRVIIRDLVADFDRGNEDERELIPLMLLLSGLLILLAGISLWIAMMFAVAERTREFGIMKVVGFSPGQIVQSVITGATLLALVGIVIGIPLGYYLTTEVFMRLASTEGAPDDLFQLPSALWLLGIVAATVGMAIVGALLPAWHAAGIRVADAFRFE